MGSVLVLQHAPCETLGTIADVLRGHAIGFNYIQSYVGEPVPGNLDGAGGLIVMGGPMGVYEQATYPFLRDEMRLIEAALKAQWPVLGVCLGSQLLAAVLGANVFRGEKKELGWHDVTLTQGAAANPLFMGVQREFRAFHWHGDIFSLPGRAVGLAASDLTPCQAFCYGQNAYGILFHLEVTEPQISQMLVDFADELRAAGGNGAEIAAQIPRHLPATQEIGRQVFGHWASML